MKFLCKSDKEIFEAELATSGLSEADFIKRRKGIIKKMINFRKSQRQKQTWRKYRSVYKKGIKRFNRSTQGKKFHKDLGRFLATRDMGSLAYAEAYELVKPVSSILTHAFIETEYYFMSLTEEIEYRELAEIIYDEVLNILTKIRKGNKNFEVEEEFLFTIVETTALVKSLADKYGVSVADVEKMWKEIEQALKDDGKNPESDDRFYGLLVNILKKKLEKGK